MASLKSGITSVQDLIAKAKAGELYYGSSGNGSAAHLAIEQLRAAAGIKLTHVPFKGNAEAYLALQSGDIQLMSDAIPGAVGPVRTGKVKAISIADDKRSPYLPDLPTAIEQGLPGVIAVGWIGLEAPANVPTPILDRLNAEMQRILKDPAVVAKLKDLSFIPAGESREAFAAYIAAEIAKWRGVIQTAGVRID